MSDNEYWLVAVPGESNQREARTGLNERLRNYSLVMDFQIPELKVCLASLQSDHHALLLLLFRLARWTVLSAYLISLLSWIPL